MTTAPRDANAAYHVKVSLDEAHYALMRMPQFVRNWLEYEAPIPYNPINALEYYDNHWPPITWAEVLRQLKEAGHKDHRAAFGGVHPQLDPPRTVW